MNATYCTIVRPNLVLQFCVYQYDISTTKDIEFFLGIFGISKCDFWLNVHISDFQLCAAGSWYALDHLAQKVYKTLKIVLERLNIIVVLVMFLLILFHMGYSLSAVDRQKLKFI